MRSRAYCTAVSFVSSRTAPFDAWYCGLLSSMPTRPSCDEMLTIDPPPARRSEAPRSPRSHPPRPPTDQAPLPRGPRRRLLVALPSPARPIASAAHVRDRSGGDYTPAVIISRAVAENLTKASWIRRMFEEGARLKQERGADKVFDFTLGNPEIEPPPAVLAAARRVLDSDAPHLHAYMPNAGHPRVREAVATRLRQATGFPYTANHVLMTVGAGAALNTVLKALLDPGDEVITVAPFFAEYTFYAENHGGRLVVVQPTAHLPPDLAEPEGALPPETPAILVNLPDQPTRLI